MNNPLKELQDTEDFFHFFRVPFHPEILKISRVHILKKFRYYLQEEGYMDADSNDKEIWNVQRALLTRAYRDFVRPTPLRQRFFSEFYKKNGQFIAFNLIKIKGDSK